MKELVYSIWLSLACTPDTSTFPKLAGAFGSAKSIYEATEGQIRSAVGANNSDCKSLFDKDLRKAEEVLEFCTSKRVGIVTFFDKEYPLCLKNIPTPPVLLYYRGVLPDFNKRVSVAVVGTRSLSDCGRNSAFKLGYDLSSAGVSVVSGMAVGIDSVALAGALASGVAPVVAVLGSGIDVCYPSEHLTLAREIVKDGCILTEYAPGTKPQRFNFPRRNRIISGLSVATVVVEGREKSGSVITAKHAKKQNRRIYAFPGSVGSVNSEASNMLIKNGASLCTGADDIVRDLEKEYNGLVNPFGLSERLPVGMIDTLRRYSVSCTTPSDDIFTPARKIKAEKPGISSESSRVDTSKTDVSDEISGFEQYIIEIYKEIPPNEEISIEELVSEKYSLRQVMKALLKLEMGRFIKMLPGERVKRNI